MRGIQYRRKVNGINLVGIHSLLFYFVLVLVLTNSVLAKSDSGDGGERESRTASEFLNVAALASGLGKDGPEDKTFFGEDVDGDSIVVGTWFSYGSYTLATAMFGTGFLIACAATAVYYVLFVVTDPRQTGFTRRRRKRRYTNKAYQI